ncbi:hypothetical protein AGMMS49957_12160 [Synergistales bacterium]|nr:hypothetical protein AGMMS49957_12160 [Synergistales bacterium]
MRIVFLRLEGVLQSWGERSKWDDRDSGEFPTKSGAIGLLGCCMGIPREDERLVEISDNLHVAFRADRSGSLLFDFHTVQPKGKLMTADGKYKNGPIVSHRAYLQDASFLALLFGSDYLLDACVNALKCPVWTPYLGRKSCVPTKPLFEGESIEFSSPEEALRKWPQPPKSSTSKKPRYDAQCRVWIESTDSADRLTRQDRLTKVAPRAFAWGRYSEDVIEIERGGA